MLAVLSLLIIILISILVVRICSIALELTGLSPDVAAFQAQSAFSGVGFTTIESEAIVKHPVHRRIVHLLILMGGAGVTTSIATMVIAFVGQTGHGIAVRAQLLLVGLLIIAVFAKSKHISKVMKKFIVYALKKWTVLRVYDYEEMFGLSEGYMITKITIKRDHPFIGKTLKELSPDLGGLLILAIYRKAGSKKHLIGAPHGEEAIKSNDDLICYAREETIEKVLLKAKAESRAKT